jgi:hypothetical protein
MVQYMNLSIFLKRAIYAEIFIFLSFSDDLQILKNMTKNAKKYNFSRLEIQDGSNWYKCPAYICGSFFVVSSWATPSKNISRLSTFLYVIIQQPRDSIFDVFLLFTESNTGEQFYDFGRKEIGYDDTLIKK